QALPSVTNNVDVRVDVVNNDRNQHRSGDRQWAGCPDQGELSEFVGVSMQLIGTEACTYHYGAPDYTAFEMVAPLGAMITMTSPDNLTFTMRGDGLTWLANRVTI